MTTEVLERATWRARAAAHAARVDVFLEPHLARCGASVKHPVHDFLFTYYSHRPAQLRRWHPGYGAVLADAPEYDGLKGYRDGGVTDEFVAAQARFVRGLLNLLRATEARPAHTGCFGLHEWAMVYRQSPDELRHNAWPLRLGATGTDEVVEQHQVKCTHFDAFRFFTPPARGLNVLQPARDDRPAFEQPGCLHAGMDLYKHAFRLSPMIGSDLVADCFELARDIREMDMRAAPYDLVGLGFEPIRIETPEGKATYVREQRRFAERGAPLRRRLIEECERLLEVGCRTSPSS
ncbi:3-methyladenine DNA glycosylase [Nocardioides currus]|uniref:3-methyladenine DNA glycosylase n=1 Tax=Nocardioides currus TaxID=2133958 RepID=A0A2R7YWX6_9ACTN|nr:3-methyladenine DNA glycosylase [Nocardioides currus]PUA80831.1 3-methyladenine DNA glycosylase [Nocardioides currus]